jgi:hypothetical protein
MCRVMSTRLASPKKRMGGGEEGAAAASEDGNKYTPSSKLAHYHLEIALITLLVMVLLLRERWYRLSP